VSDALVVMILLGVGTFLLKAAGPLVIGDRRLPRAVASMVELLPAALLAALAAVSTVAVGSAVTLDARAVGLVVAAVALWRRSPFVVVIIAASAATALFRLLVG
jgi:branched-subunit amino acid transport protein AzlD